MSQKPSLSACVFLGIYMKIDVIVRLVSDLPLHTFHLYVLENLIYRQ